MPDTTEAATPRKVPRPPTDRQIERLKAAERKAAARSAAAVERRIDEVRAVNRRHQPKERSAELVWRKARAALEIAQLARAGITPMHTVLRYLGGLWAVRITAHGWPELVPLKSDLTPHKGRNAARMPIRLDKLQITDKVTKP